MHTRKVMLWMSSVVKKMMVAMKAFCISIVHFIMSYTIYKRKENRPNPCKNAKIQYRQTNQAKQQMTPSWYENMIIPYICIGLSMVDGMKLSKAAQNRQPS